MRDEIVLFIIIFCLFTFAFLLICVFYILYVIYYTNIKTESRENSPKIFVRRRSLLVVRTA